MYNKFMVYSILNKKHYRKIYLFDAFKIPFYSKNHILKSKYLIVMKFSEVNACKKNLQKSMFIVFDVLFANILKSLWFAFSIWSMHCRSFKNCISQHIQALIANILKHLYKD